MSDTYYLEQKCAWCEKITKSDDGFFGDKFPFKAEWDNVYICQYCGKKTRIYLDFVYQKVKNKNVRRKEKK